MPASLPFVLSLSKHIALALRHAQGERVSDA